jgi:GNAT superfamily N-acetyltransferase
VTSDRAGGITQLRPPERLTTAHAIQDFDSGSPPLDDWLRRRALRNEAEGASRTYVLCRGEQVVAYYCLATGAILQAEAPGRVRRNMPNPIPVVVLGRLAVDRRFQGRGLGKALLRDATLRTLQAADIAGIRALLVHAKDERGQAFYARSGFLPSPLDPFTLMLPLKDARAALDNM